MFFGAAAFNQDLSGWNVRKGISFVSARPDTTCLVRCMFSLTIVVLYCLQSGSLQANMFSYSGMNHYIGGWVFRPTFEDQLSVFGQMFFGKPYQDMSDVVRQQFGNLITPVNKESCVTKIDSALADLDLADKEKKECRQCVEKIDEIKKIIEGCE